MTTAIDYIGRKFDVVAFGGAQAQGHVQLTQSLFSSDAGGEVCTGIQKLTQRWALEFLTIRGSMPFHMSSRGSDFMSWVRQGVLRSEFDVTAYFNFAAQQVQTNLLNEETTDMPADERLQRASLLQINIFAAALTLSVNLISQAGSARQVILPIPICPANLVV